MQRIVVALMFVVGSVGFAQAGDATGVTVGDVADFLQPWVVAGIVVGAIVFLLLMTEAGRDVLGRFYAWLSGPSESQCQRVSAEMLSDMDRNLAAKGKRGVPLDELESKAKAGDQEAVAQLEAERWNRSIRVGSRVLYEKSQLEGRLILTTTGRAYVMGGEPMVDLEAIGAAMLSKVQPYFG